MTFCHNSFHRFGIPSPTRSTVLPAWFSNDDLTPADDVWEQGATAPLTVREVIDAVLAAKGIRDATAKQRAGIEMPAR